MKLKTLLNGAILLSGLGLIAYSFLVKGLRVRFNDEGLGIWSGNPQPPNCLPLL